MFKRDEAIVERVRPIGDNVRFSKTTGTYTVKRGFYYRHGYDEGQMAAAIQKAVPGCTIVEATEHYNNWPRNSWWEVRFTLPQA
jgi:hypothetical protein